MFICKDCAPKYEYIGGDNLGELWKTRMFRSLGPCEICGTYAKCINVRSDKIQRVTQEVD